MPLENNMGGFCSGDWIVGKQGFWESLFLGCKWGFLIFSQFLIVDGFLLVCVVTACFVRGYGFRTRCFG